MTERNVSTMYDVPADRIHWGLVIAGMFTAMSLLVLSSVLAFAVGFGPNAAGGYGTGAIIWGGVAAFLAFGIGGYLAARWASMRLYGNALVHGFLVWAVGVPVLVYGLRTDLGPQLGVTRSETPSGVVRAAEIPSASATDVDNSNAVNDTQSQRMNNSARAWWMLMSLAAGFIGAVSLAAVGARSRGDYSTTSHGTTHV